MHLSLPFIIRWWPPPFTTTPGARPTGLGELVTGNIWGFGVTEMGQISVSISAMHWSRCLSSRALDPESVSVGTLGSGGGSGVAK